MKNKTKILQNIKKIFNFIFSLGCSLRINEQACYDIANQGDTINN